MFTLLNELHFCTLKDNVLIKETEFGVYAYCDKKPSSDCVLFDSKRDYAVKRGILWTPNNKRPNKLRDNLKEFEEALSNNRVLYLEWRNHTSLQVMFHTGLLVTLKLSISTGDVEEIHFDRYMTGKLHSDYVIDAGISNSHAVFTYADNNVTLISFTKPALKEGNVKRWSSLDTKLNIFLLAGPKGRRLDRKISLNTTSSMVIFWWKCGRDEVYPWSPVVRDQDRANVHIYQINNSEMNLMSYFRTDFDPMFVSFSLRQSNVIHSVQQKFSQMGEVTVEWAIYEITCGNLQTKSLMSLLLPTHACLTSLSPKENHLFIACIDGSLLIVDNNSAIISSSKATFIPSLVSWHSDSCIIVIANERGQLQWFDLSLQSVRCQLLSEDAAPSNIIDIGTYLRHHSSLVSLLWNRTTKTSLCQPTRGCDDLLLLQFEKGPLAVLRLLTSKGEHGYSVDVMISQYLASSNYENAVNLLLTINWDSDGDVALSSLQSIVAQLMRLPLCPETEVFLEKALGSFHNPKYPISSSTDLEFGDPVHDLSRKFFHHLMRYQIVEKAYRLAIDLEDYDLFMDVHNYCKIIGNTDLAVAALEKADQISDYNDSQASDSSSCDCSEESCSCCSKSSTGSSEDIPQHLSAPPLPVVYPPQPAPRHKVKFSNTVTQITVPGQDELLPLMDNISINTVGLPTVDADLVQPTFHHRLYVSGGTSSSVPDSKPLCLSPRNNNIEETENGKIKVIHFGLV